MDYFDVDKPPVAPLKSEPAMPKKHLMKFQLRSFRLVAFRLLLISILSLAPAAVAICQERPEASDNWTDSSGSKTIKADFVKLDGVNLTVRMSDGTEKVVPLSKLDDKSRIKAREMAKNGAKPSASAGQSPKDGSKASKSSGPVSFPSSPSAQEFMDIIIRELKNDNPIVIWDALPATKQKQIQELLKLASTRIEQRTLNSIKKFRNDLLTALKGKKQFVLNCSQLPIPPDQKTILAGSYDSLVDLVGAYIPEDWMDISYLQQSNVRDLLASYIDKVAEKGKGVEGSLPSDSPFRSMMNQNPTAAKVEIVNAKEAMVTFELPGQPSMPVKFVFSEGRWLPELMLSGWDQNMGQAKIVLEQTNPKDVHQMVGKGLLGFNVLLGSITNAETQADFDDAIGQVMSLAQGAPGKR